MCGRYTFYTDEENREAVRIALEIEERYGKDSFDKGEIFPGNKVPILTDEKNKISPKLFTWGFPSFKGNGLIINARSETAGEKRMFSSSLKQRRCVIPSTGFFEWKKVEGKKNKEKYLFNIPGRKMVYMAGIYNEFEGEEKYVILTTGANASMKNIHHRMPVILGENSIENWIYDDKFVDILFGSEMTTLEKKLV